MAINIKRLLKSFRYASKGLWQTLREEQNLRVQSFFAILAIIMGWHFEINRSDWVFLILVILIVFLMEVVNSAIERVTDVLKPRIDGYVKEIKDIMAAAVMLASIVAAVIGLIVFWPYVFQ